MEFKFSNFGLSSMLFIVVLAQLLFVAAEPVEYTGQNVVMEGEGFSISCKLTQFDALKWLKDNQQIDELQHTIADSRNQYVFEDREENGLIVATISVKSALSNHSGTYRCSSLSNESHNLFVLGDNEVKGEKKMLTFKQGTNVELDCSKDPIANGVYVWKKDEQTLSNNEKIRIEMGKLFITKGTDDQAGNYTCNIKQDNKTVYTREFEVTTEPYAKLHKYVNVVEEEKLKIECTVYGKPTPHVQWKVNDTLYPASSGRVNLLEDTERKVPNAVLILDSAVRGDKGQYSCIAINPKNQLNMTADITVYVKGKFDALWPFLGIVAEVVILCAIILIYEKKRNNNAELEESDTDQSPDQKNTPDHGKDSVRHRK
nr:PREDICTED: basigin isoform X1 [Bemisia tabaci]